MLPWLAWRKFRVGSELGSPALRGDGVLTLAAAALAAITLAALLVNAAFDWWWADPLAALVIACTLGLEAVRGDGSPPLRLRSFRPVRRGRATSSPPQFGQICSSEAAHEGQNVHS